MKSNKETSALIDGLLKLTLVSSTLSLSLLAPNALVALDKPLSRALDILDDRARLRELQRVTSYMQKRGLVTGSYQHGLIITEKGRKRARKADFNRLKVCSPSEWDKNWRLVIFDIPETNRQNRVFLIQKLRLLGFQQLQQSVWIHPFPCRQEVAMVTEAYKVSRYVTYLKTAHIDHEEKLIDRFSTILDPVIN
jgi:hypothetical protein